MRIIAGHYRGLNLFTLEGLKTRPTKEIVREALFSSLGNIVDKTFLDLFAGSGAVGIEAISRGSCAYFNDNNNEATEIIKLNLAKIKINASISNLDAFSYLQNCNINFDYIFCDPPYNYAYQESLFDLIKSGNILKNNGLIIYEENSKIKIKENIGVYKLIKTKKYGISRLNFYKEIL